MESFIATLPKIKFFWRDKHKHEIDVIFDKFAIEVKYRNEITKRSLRSLYYFIDNNKEFKPIVISPKKDVIDDIKTMTPWEFEYSLINNRFM